MHRALQHLLATRTGLFAALVCLGILVAAAVIWWPEPEAPAPAIGPSAVPAPTAASVAPPSVPATLPPSDAGGGGQAKPARAPASRPTGSTRPAPRLDGLLVRSILVGADRRLALVDGRIVGTGDRVGSAVVMAIEPRAVVLRAAGGARRTLELARPAPGAKLR